MADFFINNMVKKSILDIIKNKDTIPSNKQIWFNLTKCMLRNFPTIEIYNLIEQAAYEVSDEQWFEKKYPKSIFKEKEIKRKSVIKINLKKSRIKKLIDDNVKITDIAKGYGLKIKGKGNMAICPFHNDTQASLGFDDKRNIFHCFGCNAKGDIIKFKQRMKKWEKEKK